MLYYFTWFDYTKKDLFDDLDTFSNKTVLKVRVLSNGKQIERECFVEFDDTKKDVTFDFTLDPETTPEKQKLTLSYDDYIKQGIRLVLIIVFKFQVTLMFGKDYASMMFYSLDFRGDNFMVTGIVKNAWGVLTASHTDIYKDGDSKVKVMKWKFNKLTPAGLKRQKLGAALLADDKTEVTTMDIGNSLSAFLNLIGFSFSDMYSFIADRYANAVNDIQQKTINILRTASLNMGDLLPIVSSIRTILIRNGLWVDDGKSEVLKFDKPLKFNSRFNIMKMPDVVTQTIKVDSKENDYIVVGNSFLGHMLTLDAKSLNSNKITDVAVTFGFKNYIISSATSGTDTTDDVLSYNFDVSGDLKGIIVTTVKMKPAVDSMGFCYPIARNFCEKNHNNTLDFQPVLGVAPVITTVKLMDDSRVLTMMPRYMAPKSKSGGTLDVYYSGTRGS